MPTLIKPVVGGIYNFKFQTGYTKFDGVHKVVKIMTYDEYVSDGGDIFADFYKPNQKTEDDVSSTIDGVMANDILKVVQPNYETVEETLYIPTYFLEETPDYNVSRYHKFGIIANVGVIGDPDNLNFMKANITEAFESVLGITPDVSFVALEEKWLTDEQYQEILSERDDTKKKSYNYYKENLRLQKQISQANTKINEYERLIISLKQQLDALTS
jgi:hypothetical protein